MNIPLHPATINDANDVAGLLTTLGYPCSADEAVERIHSVDSDDRRVLLLAYDNEAAVGLLALEFIHSLELGAMTCRIAALVVAPNARRSGVGRVLLQEAERRARAANAVRLVLTSASHRHEAHAFYRACGYAETGLRFAKLLGD